MSCQQTTYIAASPAPSIIAASPAPVAIAASPAPVAVAAVAPAAAVAVEALPALPPVNASCYAPPPVAPGVNTSRQVQLPTEERIVETNDADEQTVVRENNNYTTFNKTVVTTVNRNHLHTQRVITNENNYNTYVTNKVVKVNDIHRQQVENVKGETRVINDYKQSQVVEPAKCLRAVDGVLAPCQQ